MSRETTCEFKGDQDDAIGADGEVLQDDAMLVCESPAVCRVRPKGGWHLREYGSDVPMCEPHALHLVEDAPADWEMLERFAYGGS